MELRKLRYLVTIIVGGIAGILLAQRNIVGFVTVFLIGYTLMMLIDRAAKKSWEPLYDERDFAIDAIAARTTIRVYMYIVGFAVLAMYVVKILGILEVPEGIVKIVNALLISMFVLLVIHVVSWIYYRCRFGG